VEEKRGKRKRTLLERLEFLRSEVKSCFSHLEHRLNHVLEAKVLEVEEAQLSAGRVERINLLLVTGGDSFKVDNEERVAFEVGGEVGAGVLLLSGDHGVVFVLYGVVGRRTRVETLAF
jgi:hypothetical protein